jgi:hypothetical protein
MPSIEIFESAKLDWHEALCEANLSAEDIRLGLVQARKLEWPCSIGEFLRLCKPVSIAAHKDVEGMIEELRSFKKEKDGLGYQEFKAMKEKIKISIT